LQAPWWQVYPWF